MSFWFLGEDIVISDENAKGSLAGDTCLKPIRGLWINMHRRVCRFPHRKAMNILTPRGSNYNKGIAPVTRGKLQDHLCNPWSN